MAMYHSSGSRAGAAVVLSPQQFHAEVEAALRAAIAAGPDDAEGWAEAERRLSGILLEVPGLGPRGSPPPHLAPMLVSGVRWTIGRRSAEAIAGSEQLLGDLMEFVLAFYPEAVPPPPLWSEAGAGRF